ncbi:hypothetical protein M3Y97_00883300 [Aphelenchoides bicaudatus]|nr:hypothetical protein M3Y97_00883300 [Aphelenchoides bicaudatus]
MTSSPHYAKRVTVSQSQQPPVQQQRPPSSSPSNSLSGEDASVVVKIQPDSQGRFGFNVTGGSDCSHPLIISRIIAGSAADRCFPRLNEGDQVLKINGQNISHWSYGNCVNFIRSLRTYGEMTLTIKPNVYRCVELDEPENHQYIMPPEMHVSETVPQSNKLAQSLVLLKEAIETDTIVKQFEQLYRKKAGLSMEQSQLPNNIRKNRYRDVRPYDQTRVILQRAPSGDYINASHVNVKIPSTGIVNTYVATQGPLPNTTGDFWYMVWEQGSTNIIMLTTLLENGRQKCHQYWPDLNETMEFGQLVISNLDEREERYAHYREILIRNKLTREERRVTQIQYVAWPDHGVARKSEALHRFCGRTGIGRTGVLILMETAACLIESNEPVYPLDIVRIMRDQRAMMIQTSEQFQFTCECIIRAYGDGVLKPLAIQ